MQRFKDGFTLLPSFYEISQLYNQDNAVAQEVAYSSGYVAGYELKTIGVDINFSPVVDLTSKSTVMSERTLSASPEVVISLASSYIRGLIDNGILPTLKHFPGHGAVTSDTHTDISKCNLTLHELSSHVSTFKDLHEKYKLPIMILVILSSIKSLIILLLHHQNGYVIYLRKFMNISLFLLVMILRWLQLLKLLTVNLG